MTGAPEAPTPPLSTVVQIVGILGIIALAFIGALYPGLDLDLREFGLFIVAIVSGAALPSVIKRAGGG